MTVARYKASDLADWQTGQTGSGAPRRSIEGRLLAAALATVVLGLVLTYLAEAASFAEVEEDLASGRIVHLNELRQPEDLLPLLGSFTDPRERAFVADRVWGHLTRVGGEPAANVGELATLRVSAAELAGRTLPELKSRAAALHDEHPGRADDELRVRLLSADQVRALKPRAVVRSPRAFLARLILWAGLFLLAWTGAHLVLRSRRFSGDPIFLPVALLLSGVGLLAMVSIWDPLRDSLYFQRFSQGVIFGCAVLVILALTDFERPVFRRMTLPALLVAFGLSVLLIVFGSGPGQSDAKVNLFGFQPVELIKLLAVLFLAGYFAERWAMLRELEERRGMFARLAHFLRIPKLEYVLAPVVAMAILLLFFFLQRDLGPALVLALLFLGLYGIARARMTMVAAGLAIVVGGFAVGYRLGFPRTVSVRVAMWLAPWDNPYAGGDHLAHSLWALATGGLTGTGPGLGQPGFVPAVHTDMVLAALGEELGFLGLSALLGLYALLLFRGLRAADRGASPYGYFLALGISLLLGLQLLLIAGGVAGLLPLAGVVTPFLSYGRSAMVTNFALLGVLLSVSARPASDRPPGRRFRGGTVAVGVLLAAGLCGILARFAYVQVLRGDHVLSRASLALQADGYRRFRYNPRLVQIGDLITRGTIFDRNGVPLAFSKPEDLDEEQRAELARLGALLEAGGNGRFYPFEGKVFHLLGDYGSRVNWAASNTSFVERDSRVRLQGYDDYARIRRVRQPNGRLTDLVESDYRALIPLLRNRHRPKHPAVRRILERDRDVTLSIDVRLQLEVADILAAGTRAYGGKGAAVVLDAATGDVFASVSVPWPERRPVTARAGVDRLIDRARYGLYPPGSTFKIVTAMAALRKDPGLAARTFECVRLADGRVGQRIRGWGRPVRDDRSVVSPHGEVDMEEGIRVSCNAYFAQLATLEVGPGPLLETAAELGIDVATPNTPEQLADALPQSAYGQGQVTATPLEMARVAAVVANGGAAPSAHWLMDEQGDPPVQIVSAGQAEYLARAMRKVVTRGSAQRALGAVGLPIAGKTGTAEVEGGPSHSWFIGFAPAGTAERKIAFAVLIEHGGYGGRAAAEVAGKIVRELNASGYIE